MRRDISDFVFKKQIATGWMDCLKLISQVNLRVPSRSLRNRRQQSITDDLQTYDFKTNYFLNKLRIFTFLNWRIAQNIN